MKKFALLSLLVTGMYFSGQGSHIVGGFMSYTYVSDSTYNVTMTVYRDCNSTTLLDGAPGSSTPFATIGVFETDNNLLVNTLYLTDPILSSIGPPINNPCLQINTHVCVQEGQYIFTVTLPSSTLGYTIVYERCCRNATVTNVSDPGAEGDVFSAYIPPTNTYHNNSPVFNGFPPIFICVNSPLVYNNSATDPDGDVLRYSLCTPYTGGSTINPAPDPPTVPFDNTITWEPPYSDANLLGGVPLAIDSISGELTGTPSTIGQFVVGVCVSEYRNGTLLATHLRDFQFNVTQCNLPIANIPSIDINPSTGIGIYDNLCNSKQVVFQNNSYDPPPADVPIEFEWSFGVQGSTTDTSSQEYPTYTYPDTGTFLVRLIAIKGDSGSICQDTTYAYVNIYPTFQAGFTADNACTGYPAIFQDTSTTTYGTINHWSWSFGDGSTSNQQDPSHLYSSPGTYSVTLIDGNTVGCADTAQGTIIIYSSPNGNFNFTAPQCIYEPIAFSDSSSGITAYNWNFGNRAASTQSSPEYTYDSAGSYTVTLIVASPDGCLDTVSQNITIHPLPVIGISNDTTICPFSSARLSAGGGVSYLWSPGNDLSDSAIANPLATPQPPGSAIFTVKVTDQFQCTNTDSVTISFYPIPQINAGPDTSVCLNPVSFHDSTQLHASGGVSYVWSPPTGLSATNIPDPWSRPPGNTTYYVTGTDTNGCSLTDSVTVYYLDPALNLILQDSVGACFGDTAYATVLNQGASEYIWTPSQYLTNPNSWNTGFYPPDTTEYILTVSNYCYQKSDSVLIIIWPLPQLALNPLDSVCIGDSVQLFAYNAASYQWYANPTLSNDSLSNPFAEPIATTVYRVTGTSQYGCENSDSAKVIVYFPSVITVSPNVPFICRGSGVELLASGAYSYAWSPASSLSAANIADPVATPQDTTVYTVVATNIHGCQTTDSLTINVQMPVTAFAPSPYNACVGARVQLHAAGGFFYLWQPSQGLNDSTSSAPVAAPDSSAVYIVTVSNDCFSDTASVDVIVHQLPEVSAGTDTTIWRDTHADLHGTTTASNYYWNPSQNVADPLSLSTTASPQQTTWYQLLVIDEFGCQNADSVLITVIPHIILDLPTGFSPNNDGVNDIFHIVRYLDIDHIEEFAVYDRWGVKVFSTDNINAGWDGTYQGKPQPIGVYVWMIVAQTGEGEQYTAKGNVTLIR